LVAVITDVIRDGKPVVGYGFNSNGRYGQGKLMQRAVRPARPRSRPGVARSTTRGDNLDPHKIWNTMFTNEKPGGHGERSVAIGTIDMAVWDAVAKIAGQAPLPAAGRPLRRRQSRTARSSSTPPGGYYYPGQDHNKLQDEMRSYIDRGYTVVKKKIGGASLDEDLRRIDSPSWRCCRTARGSASTRTAASTSTPPSPTPRRCRSTTCSGTKEPGDPLDYELQAALRNYYREPDGHGRETSSRCRTRAT
jgi:hypothetical protein